jgi:hypothetical protein
MQDIVDRLRCATHQIDHDAADEIERLRAENAALKYSLQLDEDLIGKIQQIISILASRPVWTPNVPSDRLSEDKGKE